MYVENCKLPAIFVSCSVTLVEVGHIYVYYMGNQKFEEKKYKSKKSKNQIVELFDYLVAFAFDHSLLCSF